jgi:hypothetical protein
LERMSRNWKRKLLYEYEPKSRVCRRMQTYSRFNSSN